MQRIRNMSTGLQSSKMGVTADHFMLCVQTTRPTRSFLSTSCILFSILHSIVLERQRGHCSFTILRRSKALSGSFHTFYLLVSQEFCTHHGKKTAPELQPIHHLSLLLSSLNR